MASINENPFSCGHGDASNPGMAGVKAWLIAQERERERGFMGTPRERTPLG
jgi:hypothetical protein